VKEEYRAMASTTYELKSLLKELKFREVTQMTLICEYKVGLHIISNLLFHERVKHIDVDCHFI